MYEKVWNKNFLKEPILLILLQLLQALLQLFLKPTN